MADYIVPLITLIALELVLGIDNIIFISILTEKLPANQQNKLRYWGLGLAVVMRLILLTGISYILKLNTALFNLAGLDISGKDLILIVGGSFLIYKSVK
jgi:predicted tellurium resistance membrane protein TerC